MAIAEDIQALNDYLEETAIPLDTVRLALELRIAQLEPNGTSSALSHNSLNISSNDGVVTNSTAIDLAGASNARNLVFIHNHGSSNIKINFDRDASANSAVYAIPGGTTLVEDTVLAGFRISAIAVSGSIDYTIVEVFA